MKPKTIFVLVVVVCTVIAGFMLGLPKFNSYQFQDDVTAIAKFESAKTDEELRNMVMKKAKENNVDIKPEDVIISHDNNMLTITIDYSVVVDLQVKQITLDFHIQGPPKN